MLSIPFSQVKINDPFWSPRLLINAGAALDHQWQQLEKSGCFHNFRILANQESGFREGWFFADSDAYKWLDAAARVYATFPSDGLKQKMDLFIQWISGAQEKDGYLYTYNQIHFPNQRWENLQIEHELYCHGHLIEAAISHFLATSERTALTLAEKSAHLLLKTFLGAGALATPGHEEIEIALIRLAQATGNPNYLDLAEQFLMHRGRSLLFPLHMLQENARVEKRTAFRNQQRDVYYQNHPEEKGNYILPAHNSSKKPPYTQLRWMVSALNGKYFQQHKPVWQQKIPVGHAVRFAYLQTALAKLAQVRHDENLLTTLEKSWQHMVEKRMYVTGGIGSLPLSEGFGRDYELDPEFAYAETCAALGAMFWNWEMTQLTGKAQYADLFEWQLYNASMVGIGQDGCSYLYNNPLSVREGYPRQSWYEIPCCPSNVSRTWANLGEYLYSCAADQIWVHQYVSSQVSLGFEDLIHLETSAALPWEGKVTLRVFPQQNQKFTLYLRFPSWCEKAQIQINQEEKQIFLPQEDKRKTASGYNPWRSYYISINREWSPADEIQINFEMPVRRLIPHPKVKSCIGKSAISRGPVVYCLEETDNSTVDILNASFKINSLQAKFDTAFFDGITVIKGKTDQGDELTFIPYAFWANREPGKMTVYVNLPGE